MFERRAGSEPLWRTFQFKEFDFFEWRHGVEAACVSGGGMRARDERFPHAYVAPRSETQRRVRRLQDAL